MLLRDYLKETGETPIQFGTRIGARGPATVYRYLSGARRPTPRLMQRIMAETGGRVTPVDFFAAPPVQVAA